MTTSSVTDRVTVHFDRIGRTHDVTPLAVDSGDADAIAEQVERYARRFLMSHDVVVSVDMEDLRGNIFCGFHVGGTFTIKPLAVTA